ncbi:GxxExxY protein [Azospirillum doebereinerae]|uniref:GxxExxY protein n=1 Tax=Azospirillum doebereinerae TaxID=92933 RepID=A0A433JFR9_9PROT|nr:GxxExxY protein [Azospirillum doebereinerae]MCG5241029.1 GxxExxY protein [Azospirillum doebereinerae]RUQ76016.1 GxxExxY protein [Azospirillum doebereinerae]
MIYDDRTGSPSDPLTAEIIGAAFAVSNTFGHGFLESVYKKSLAHELTLRNLSVREEVEHRIHYKNALVGRYVADLVVADSVIVEVKATESITGAHLSQTLNYLKASRLPKGLILNFGTPKLGIQRVLNPDFKIK